MNGAEASENLLTFSHEKETDDGIQQHTHMNNTYYLSRLFTLVVLSLSSVLGTFAQTSLPLIAEFRTSAYETNGESNSIQMTIGGIAEKDYVDIDCGFGTEEHEIVPANYDSENETWNGTTITLNVSAEGVVRVYGNAENINILSAYGCYFREVDIDKLSNLIILDLSHNELERLDLTALTKLQALYVNDNPFNLEPLTIGTPKNDLAILDIGQTDHINQAFNLSDYPSMVAFDAWSCNDLQQLDPSGCPYLRKISIDSTPVTSLNTAGNPLLTILNISDTGIRNIDLSKNTELQQFYCDHLSGSVNSGVHLEKLDVSNNPYLLYLFAAGNALTDIDVSNNPYLMKLFVSNNKLTNIDLSQNPYLESLVIRRNNFDFATLPAPNSNWVDYDYTQDNMPVDRSYKVGDVIDLSQRVLREGTETTCAVYRLSDADPSVFEELGDDFYTYDDGRITLHRATSDSVYIAFANSLFPEFTLDGLPLRTTKFVVKSAEDYGTPVRALSFTAESGEEVAFKVGMRDASATEPRTFYADLGDGELRTFTTTAEATPETVTVTATPSGSVTLYIPEGEDLTAFVIEGHPLKDIDLTAAHMLSELTLNDTQLTDIDLSWNRMLTRLDMSGNSLDSLNLRGVNDAFQKNLLATINLPSNGIGALTMVDNYGVHHLNLANNRLTELSLRDADNMETIDLHGNALTTINLTYCEKLTSARLSDNNLTSIVMPSDVTYLDELDVEGNMFRFATLPYEASDFRGSVYRYGRQDDITIGSKGIGMDLSDQLYGEDGETGITLLLSDGTVLNAGTDYTIDEGKVRFSDDLIGRDIHAELRHPAFPDLVLSTTVIQMAGMPTHLLGEFDVNTSDAATLILRSDLAENSICIDWSGEGFDLQNYVMSDMPTTFEIKPQAGRTAKIWSYEEDDHLTVFSIRNVGMDRMDLSGMKNLIALNVISAGLSEISLPQSPELFEMNLEDNNFSDLDFTMYPQLSYLGLTDNEFTKFDASKYPKLQLLSISRNNLSEIIFDNPRLWSLDLAGNGLEKIDLSSLSDLYQCGLSENNLTEIDLTGNKELRVLFLDHNRFNFATLPLGTELQLYTYAGQENLSPNFDGGVSDLSATAAAADGTPTTFRWFIGEPYYDEYDELTGEELIVDVEFNTENGRTSFHTLLDGVVGALTNDALPGVVLLTEEFDVTSTAGIDTPTIDTQTSVEAAYTADGRRTDLNGSGIVIYRMTDGTSKKVIR